MIGALRALVSIVMLTGFLFVAFVEFCLLIVVGVLIGEFVSGLLATKVVVTIFIGSGVALIVGTYKAIRHKPEPPGGLPVSPQDAPELWATVRQLAAAVRTRMPDEIRLVPEVNAAVNEHAKLLGLIPGRRYLYIGLPLLQAMTVDQIRAVIAHELGHYSGMHTRLSGIAYRGRLAVAGAISRLSPYNPVGWGFRVYGAVYRMVDNAVVRRQELEADRAAVRVAGRDAAVAALRELPGLGAAWSFFFRRYVEPGWTARLAPDDLFGGFGALVSARADELARLRDETPEAERSRWSTHPPIAERIAAMAHAPETDAVRDGRPAGALLPDLAALGRRMQEVAVDIGDRQVLPWPEFTAAAIAAGRQSEADGLLRAVSRATGKTPADLETVLELVETNQLGGFAVQFFDNATKREAAELFAKPMELLLDVAAIRSGVAHYRMAWSGPAEFVGADGKPFSLAEIAALAVSADTLPDARKRLADLGIDTAALTVVEERATARGARVIGGLANVKVDNFPHDVILLNSGFVFVPDPGKVGKGRERLRGLVGSSSAESLAERYRFLPYEEIATVVIEKRTPIRARLTLHDGRVIELREKWDGEDLEKNSRKTAMEVLGSFGG